MSRAFAGLLAAVAAVTLAGSVRAATPLAAGGHVVTGSISFASAGGSYYAGDSGDRTQEWSVQPGGGVLIADGLAMNVLISGTWFRQGDVVANRYEMGPTLEYYFDTVGDGDAKGHGIPYLGAGVLWGRAHSELAGAAASYNSTCTLLRAGLAWMIGERIAADISVMHRFGVYIEKEPLDGPRTHGNRWTAHWGIKVFLP